jgi:hypothetical protein
VEKELRRKRGKANTRVFPFFSLGKKESKRRGVLWFWDGTRFGNHRRDCKGSWGDVGHLLKVLKNDGIVREQFPCLLITKHCLP